MTKNDLLKNAKSILLNTKAVQGLLDGKKSIIIKLVPDKLVERFYDYDDYCNSVMPSDITCTRDYEQTFFTKRARYKVDDILYVKETYTYGEIVYGENQYGDSLPYIESKDDGYFIPKEYALSNGIGTEFPTWKPSVHMPKEEARLFLKVTNVYVVPLQTLGINDLSKDRVLVGSSDLEKTLDFVNQWNSELKKDEFDYYRYCSNPWVYVIEFERINYDK